MPESVELDTVGTCEETRRSGADSILDCALLLIKLAFEAAAFGQNRLKTLLRRARLATVLGICYSLSSEFLSLFFSFLE